MLDPFVTFMGELPLFSPLVTYWPRILSGTWVTLQLVTVSFLFGGVLALLIANVRLSKNVVGSSVATAYVVCFRGVPLLCLLYLVYYGAGEFRGPLQAVGLWAIFKNAYFCGIFALILNTSAYQAEIYRGAIKAVPKGQREAAAALGITRWNSFRHVVLPQAMRLAIRPLGNEVVSLIKASALTAIITVFDLMGQTRLIFSKTFDLSIYLWAAVIYLALTEGIRRAVLRFESRALATDRRIVPPREMSE